MSDDNDDNIVEFKSVKQTKTEVQSDSVEHVAERVINCLLKGDECLCKYCLYKEGAAEMLLEFLSQDMSSYSKKTGTTFASYDAKDILFRAANIIKEMEKDTIDEES